MGGGERPGEGGRGRHPEARDDEDVEIGQSVVVADDVVQRQGQPGRGPDPGGAADHPDLDRVDRAVDPRPHPLRRAEDVEEGGEAGVEAPGDRCDADMHVANGSR